MSETKNTKMIIRHFSPAWFAASMGTGGLANLLYQLENNSQLLKTIAQILGVLNLIMFISFLIPWILRWVFHLDKLKEDIKHPIMSNFFVTMPVAGIILGTNFFIMGKDYFSMPFITTLSLVFWCIGVILALILGIFITYNMMMSENMKPEITNFSWFITPVASIVIPLLGNMLVKYYVFINLPLAKFINLINLNFFGIGFTLFIILSSIVLHRFIYYKMPPAMVLPTFWIILGPIGVGTISLMGLADTNVLLGLLQSSDSIKLLAMIFWGFGLWAFGLISLVTIKYLKQGKIPFSLSWWAFIFPLAAYSLSSLIIYQYTKVQFIFIFTIILIILLVIIWVITLIRTIIGIANGKLLIPADSKTV